MKLKTSYHIKSMVALVVVTMLFSCNTTGSNQVALNVDDKSPLSIIYDVDGIYTKSGTIKFNLKAPKIIDYSKRNFPFREFPEGINLDLYADDGTKSNIIADYAVIYTNSGLIDLKGNVTYTTSKKQVLTTSQLYYDQTRSWVFTDHSFNFKSPAGEEGAGTALDSDKDFNSPSVLNSSGLLFVDANQ